MNVRGLQASLPLLSEYRPTAEYGDVPAVPANSPATPSRALTFVLTRDSDLDRNRGNGDDSGFA